jgi:hypothetical protein
MGFIVRLQGLLLFSYGPNTKSSNSITKKLLKTLFSASKHFGHQFL